MVITLDRILCGVKHRVNTDVRKPYRSNRVKVTDRQTDRQTDSSVIHDLHINATKRTSSDVSYNPT